MLAHLRQRVVEALATVQEVLLATSGPAEIQASRVPCEAHELRLYLLVPRASDHLFNLEQQPEIVVVNREWELRGRARVLHNGERPAELGLGRRPEAAWSEWVEVAVEQFHHHAAPGRAAETIDIEA
jgi:hypothetical protein